MRISNKAFTIVELLVVITIIGLLMALLLPGLNSMKGRAREAQCMNRQRSIGQAMIAYASKKEYFPGRVSRTRIRFGDHCRLLVCSTLTVPRSNRYPRCHQCGCRWLARNFSLRHVFRISRLPERPDRNIGWPGTELRGE